VSTEGQRPPPARFELTRRSQGLILLASGLSLATALILLAAHLRIAGELSRELTRQRIHLEKVAELHQLARSTHIAILERWLTPLDERATRETGIEHMIADVRRTNREFEQLEALNDDEAGARGRLSVAVALWSNRVQQAVVASDGPSATHALRAHVDAIDAAAGEVTRILSQAGASADSREHTLARQQAQLQAGLALASCAVLVLAGLWFRAKISAEARLRVEQTARREQARIVKAREAIFANMSHELRTPLAAIMNRATTLLDDASTEAREAAVAIRREAQVLLDTIQNILDAAKLRAGHVKLTFEDLAIGPVLERAVRRCEPLVGTKPVSIVTLVEPGLPLVHTDFVHLQHVLLNLIGNAIKFTSSGSVVVRATSKGPECVVVEVEDTGVGIAAEALERIWEPFTQADDRVARDFGGTGLGLSIVRNLVSLLGGEVSVRSTLGKGTTFQVALPATRAVAA
jgi:signal transduction histidine kinase